MHYEDNGGSVAWFLVGVILGAAGALLLAPQSGRETRDTIRRSALTGRERAEAAYDRGREYASGAADRGRDLYERGRHAAEEAAGRFRHEAGEAASSATQGV